MLAVVASACEAERLRGLPTVEVLTVRGADERVRMLLMLTGVCAFCAAVFSRLSAETPHTSGEGERDFTETKAKDL